jgi:hypothetical protein
MGHCCAIADCRHRADRAVVRTHVTDAYRRAGRASTPRQRSSQTFRASHLAWVAPAHPGGRHDASNGPEDSDGRLHKRPMLDRRCRSHRRRPSRQST